MTTISGSAPCSASRRSGPTPGYVDGALREVVRFIEDLHVAEVGDEEIEFLHC